MPVSEEWIIEGDVAPGEDTAWVVLFDERLATDSEVVAVIVTDVFISRCDDAKVDAKYEVFCTLLILVEVTYVRVIGVFEAAVVCSPIVLNFGIVDERLLEGGFVVAIGLLVVFSDEEVVPASGGVLDAVSGVLRYVEGVEKSSGFQVVIRTR